MNREPGGEADFATESWPSLDAFLAEVLRVDARPMGQGIALDDTVYVLDARLELNPYSVQSQRLPARSSEAPGPGEVVLDTVMHWAEAWKPGKAERTATAAGHPFRGDRLPIYPPRPTPTAPP